MGNQAGRRLNDWKKLLLTVGVTALCATMVGGALTTQRMRAQVLAGAADRPAFGAASIKVTTSGSGSSRQSLQPGGRFTTTNSPLRLLITIAYQIKPQQISGLPDWGSSEEFNIEAKAEGNPPKEQIYLMLQSLLADRFKLAVHHETRQLPVYGLVLAKAGKTGPQLQPHLDDSNCPESPAASPPQSRPGDGFPPAPCGGVSVYGRPGIFRMEGRKITMDNFISSLLSTQMDRVVIDRTGLSGLFDVTLDFAPLQPLQGARPAPDASASDVSAPPSIFTALQEQLGLKLEPQKGPVDVLLIDHVEEPSPN